MRFIRNYFSIFICVVMVICSFSFVGCEKSDNGEGYTIYYKNTDDNMLVEGKVKIDATQSQQIADELAAQLKKNPGKHSLTSLLPDMLDIEQVILRSYTAVICFNDEYKRLLPEDEIIIRAGVVKTFSQVPGVSFVQFMVGDDAAAYQDGTLIGSMTKYDFVDDYDNQMNNVQWKDVNLYYATKNGDKLVRVNTSIAYNKNTPVEKSIVEQLIKGPGDSNLSATLPSDLKLLSISVNSGVCYVNLNSSFLNEMVNVYDEIPIYSIVNSLCSLSNIKSVRIMINGDTAKTYRDSIKLDRNFEYNQSLVSE